jgi:folylpolyglutamate synthase
LAESERERYGYRSHADLDWHIHSILSFLSFRILIFNCTNGRSSPSLLASLFSRAPANSSPSSFFSKVIFCTNTTYASGESKGDLTSTITSDLAVQEEIASAYRSLFPSSPCEVLVLGSIEEAVDVVKQASEKERGRKAEVDVLVAGSLHLVGGVMEVAGLGREEVGGLSLE